MKATLESIQRAQTARSTDNESQPWDTYRTECGRGRATYHPEWGRDTPWALYVNGTAVRHAATLDEAKAIFHKTYKMSLKP